MLKLSVDFSVKNRIISGSIFIGSSLNQRRNRISMGCDRLFFKDLMKNRTIRVFSPRHAPMYTYPTPANIIRRPEYCKPRDEAESRPRKGGFFLLMLPIEVRSPQWLRSNCLHRTIIGDQTFLKISLFQTPDFVGFGN